MKLGILADIHEQMTEQRKAIAVLGQHGAERFVVLGDVFETGKRIEGTVRLRHYTSISTSWGLAINFYTGWRRSKIFPRKV